MWPPPHIDDSDRKFFHALRSEPIPVSFIGAPVRNRSTGEWTITFARTFTGRDGHLIGMVSAGMDLSLFERLFAGIAVGGESSFSLYRDDGTLLARCPHPDGGLGRTYGHPAELHDPQAAADHEIINRASVIDGKPRLMAPHSIAHFPLISVASDTEAAVLRPCCCARASWPAW